MGKTVSEVGECCGTGVVCESYESVVYERIDEAQVSEVGVMRQELHSLCYHSVQCFMRVMSRVSQTLGETPLPWPVPNSGECTTFTTV